MAFADFPQQILHGNLAVCQNQRAGGRTANSELVFFRAGGESGRATLNQESRKLLAVDLGEHHEHVREAGVGDPHLLAVEDVVPAIGRQNRARAAVHGVGSGRGFRKGVSSNPFAGGQPRQVFLLLGRCAEPDEGKSADTGMRAERHREAGELADGVGDYGGRDFVHAQAAVGFGNIHRQKAEIARLPQQIPRDREVLALNLSRRGYHPRWT